MARLVGGPVVAVPDVAFASVTGSPPQWSDESDATFATLGLNLLGPPAGTNAYSVIAAPPAVPLTYSLHVRVATDGVPPGVYNSVFGLWRPDYSGGAEAFVNGVTTTPTDHTLTLAPFGGFTASELLTGNIRLFAQWASVSSSPTTTLSLFVYELWLEVTYAATKRAKPVRMYPANHPALGTARLYPPARSRAAGRLNGYQ